MDVYSFHQQLRSLQAPRLASRLPLKNTTHSELPRRARSSLAHVLIFVLGSAGALACESSPPEPVSEPSAVPSQPVQKATPKATPAATVSAVGAGSGSDKDPAAGKFTLAEATKDLPKTGKLTATLESSLGALSCELYEDKAPITVANFVGLARGLRPFQHEGQWQKKPAYDGTTFHRVIKGFMIQGGDPSGNGSGEPGYVIPDEKWPGAHHDQRGLLCMANRGPNTNGMQFFITDAAAPHLDQSYTIFGKCGPDAIIEKLASVETYGRSGGMAQPADRPLDPPRITKITISRK